MLNFSDIKSDIPKVIDFLDNTYFTDSTITMMNDQYLRDSIRERLSQIVLHNEGLVTLNEDQEALTRAMLRSSLTDEDVNFILNASLKVSQINVTIASSSDDKKEEEADPEKANAMIAAKKETMCSIENLISIIKDNLGTSRIVPVASGAAVMEAMVNSASSGTHVEPIKDSLYIERPLELNLDYIDLTKIDNSKIFEFLGVLMAADSNSSLGITLPIAAFIDPVRDFFTTDMEAVLDAAVEFAKNSAKNSISFNAAPDPYKSLFDTL